MVLSDKVDAEDENEGNNNEDEGFSMTDTQGVKNPPKLPPPPPPNQRDFPLYLTNHQQGKLYIPAEMTKKDYDLLKQQIDNHLAIILLTSVVSSEENQDQ